MADEPTNPEPNKDPTPNEPGAAGAPGADGASPGSGPTGDADGASGGGSANTGAGDGGSGDGSGAGDGDGSAGGKWPENWRNEIAGDDEKALKQLERYASPAEVWKKARILEQRMSSGELRTTLPDNPTDEQLKEYRESNGIPEKAEDYSLDFDDGFVVGKEDRPIIDGFLSAMHGENASPEVARKAIRWYYDEIDRQGDERSAQDKQVAQDAEETLREEWGREYRPNMSMVDNFLSTMPEELRDNFTAGRMADGTPYGSSPQLLMWLNQLAREQNPSGILTGAGDESAVKALDDRIKEIKGIMRTDKDRYKRENMHTELEDLLVKQSRLKN